MTNRLETIATRQRRTFLRDVVFASFVALATFLAVTTVSTAAEGAVQIVQR
jgi:hypothetical protein